MFACFHCFRSFVKEVAVVEGVDKNPGVLRGIETTFPLMYDGNNFFRAILPMIVSQKIKFFTNCR